MYDVDYFIKKFEAIPEDRWITCLMYDQFGNHCAEGWAKTWGNKQYDDLLELFLSRLRCFPSTVNNRQTHGYNQDTPKQRVLAALYDFKKLNQETEPSTERRNEDQSGVWADQTKNFTQLIKVVEETADCEIKIISE